MRAPRTGTPRTGRIIGALVPPLGFLLALSAMADTPAGPSTGRDAAPVVAPEEAGIGVQGTFAGKKPGRTGKELSGIACRPASGGNRDCLLIDDELGDAQRATFDGRTLQPGAMVPILTGNAPADAAVGTPPTNPGRGCGDDDDSDALDGEGVAYAGTASGEGAFYVVGSHGCSRNRGRFRRTNFLLARIGVDRTGRLAPAALSWRLSEVLRTDGTVGNHFATPLQSDGNASDPGIQGLNIEGIAATGDRLLFGLRAPALQGHAFIVAVAAADLFAPANTSAPIASRLLRVPLGDRTGIRDMAALPDGRILLLSGPVHEDGPPFAISLMTPDWNAAPGATVTPRWLARLAPVNDDKGKPAKAEAITVLGEEDGVLRVLVLFDGLPNGGPREYRLRP
ncbi:DUF3616 domain-containing protein [Roseomonas sp. NAR14]|uniref:DUF3616 domain-containing protein n=1 Tax=Roseomonas acroporae TaxID=2937791 RepID=A0A9X1YAT7_9PROT|nr:DUF3616 domain-containing protein [Roseomonas acroporae]MCK8785525.1 DUF3616 domain-containing protein [Roseomonas acroporae]